jgi:hypothetical protein
LNSINSKQDFIDYLEWKNEKNLIDWESCTHRAEGDVDALGDINDENGSSKKLWKGT